MTGYVDLHTHTNASDGSMKPAELVRHAASCGLAAIAITDHDTTGGIEDALNEAQSAGIEVMAGVEISADFERELHILGYFPGGDYKCIKPVLEQLKKNRDERNPRIIARLNELGMDITMEEVLREAAGSVVGRPHIAAVLWKKQYVKEFNEAFEKFLGYGKPAYFKKDKLSPGESIAAILSAGGVPVLAHPILLGYSNIRLDMLLEELKSKGLRGLECYYVDNMGDDTGRLLRLAQKHELLPTGGSDFHGRFKPDIALGTGRGNLRVPYECFEALKKEKA